MLSTHAAKTRVRTVQRSLKTVQIPRDRLRLWPVFLLGTSLVVGALSGCGAISDLAGGDDNLSPPAELVEFVPTVNVEIVWSRQVGSGTDEQYLKLTPAVAGDRVYVANRDGSVQALDALTGARIWETEVTIPITGGPGTGEDLVLVGSSEGKVLALNALDGTLLWTASVSSEVLSAPNIGQGVVVARTIDGKVFGLDAGNGKRLWVYDRTVPILTLRGTSSPAIAQGIVVTGFDSGRLVALSIDIGQPLWETHVAQPTGRSELERLVDIDADPIIVGNTVYAVSFQGRIAAIDLQTGDILWRRDMSSYAGLGFGTQHLYVADDDSQIWALNPRDSAAIWQQAALSNRAVTAPIGFKDYVIVGDNEGYVHWMSNVDGKFVARQKIDGDGIITAPVVSGDMVYIYGRGGDLAAMRVAQ